MLSLAFRRVVTMLVALAFLVGLQMAAMPMAVEDGTAVKVSEQSAPSQCKGCNNQSMTVSECSALCVSVSGLTGPVTSVMPIPDYNWWTRLAENVSTVTVQPDLSPPRA